MSCFADNKESAGADGSGGSEADLEMHELVLVQEDDPPVVAAVRDPTTWTLIRHDGPNHLGIVMRCTNRASNGPNHLGLCALQAAARVVARILPGKIRKKNKVVAAVSEHCVCSNCALSVVEHAGARAGGEELSGRVRTRYGSKTVWV